MSKKGKVSNEFKIGLTVVVCGVLLIFGINYLKGENIFKQQDIYYAVYDDIDLLKTSNPVYFNGKKIGLVKSIELNAENRVEVGIIIDEKGLSIPKDSKATISDSDLLGSKGIVLELGESEEMAQDGDYLIAAVDMNMAEALKKELEPLKQKTDELIGGIDAIVTNLKAVFEDDATQDLPKAFESLQRSLENLEGITQNVDGVVSQNAEKLSLFMNDITAISGNLKDNNESLNTIIANFESISDSLAQTNLKQTIFRADSAMTELNNVVEKINRGEGTIGMLLNNDSLHNSLVASNAELQFLINDIYENPWRYVHISIFGKKQEKRYSRKELKQLRQLIDEALEEEESGTGDDK